MRNIKKLNVLCFMAGAFFVALLWIICANLIVVGNVNGVPIYRYQVRQYLNTQYIGAIQYVIDDVLSEQAEKDYKKIQNKGDEFSEFYERYKKESNIVWYGW